MIHFKNEPYPIILDVNELYSKTNLAAIHITIFLIHGLVLKEIYQRATCRRTPYKNHLSSINYITWVILI